MKFPVAFSFLVSYLATSDVVAFESRELVAGSEGVGNERGTVSIQTLRQDHFCGGALIADDMVLTAAHCVSGMAKTGMFIKVGSNKLLGGGGAIIRSLDYAEHGGYNSRTQANDIAIIRLSRGAGIGFKRIDRGTQSTTSGIGTLYGWGSTPSGSRPNEQQRVSLPLQPDSACSSLNNGQFRYSNAGNLCAGSLNPPKSSCQGDSGGPLYKGPPSSRTIIGLVSYGLCGRQYSRMTTVSAYRNWIDSTIRALRSSASSRNINSRCRCSGADDLDVGQYCSNWLDAPISWCYTEDANCASPVESKRYGGRYWTQCNKSLYDETVSARSTPTTPDASLGTEDFTKAIPPKEGNFDPDVESEPEAAATDTSRYALIGGITAGVGLTAVGGAIGIMRRRRRTNNNPTPTTTMPVGNVVTSGPPSHLMNVLPQPNRQQQIPL